MRHSIEITHKNRLLCSTQSISSSVKHQPMLYHPSSLVSLAISNTTCHVDTDTIITLCAQLSSIPSHMSSRQANESTSLQCELRHVSSITMCVILLFPLHFSCAVMYRSHLIFHRAAVELHCQVVSYYIA